MKEHDIFRVSLDPCRRIGMLLHICSVLDRAKAAVPPAACDDALLLGSSNPNRQQESWNAHPSIGTEGAGLERPGRLRMWIHPVPPQERQSGSRCGQGRSPSSYLE